MIHLFKTPLLAGLCAAIFAAFTCGPAAAQTPSLFGGDNETPIEVTADGGIEWQRDASVFIARENATATRGDTIVRADELRAYYRQTDSDTNKEGGSSEIWRLDAIGHVQITAPGWLAEGGLAIYDVAGAVIVLKDANPIKLTSGEDIITATEQVEFWSDRKLAVARGNATAVRGERRIRADVLSAHFEPGPDGKDRVRLVEGFDRVQINTAGEQATSERAAYDVVTGLARLVGSVIIKRGENQLQGCSADLDLNTGISRLKSCPPKPGSPKGSGRVKGVLMPGAAAK